MEPHQRLIGHDPKNYSRPEVFDPERFSSSLGPNSGLPTSAAKDPRDYIFGFGRRACPGQEVAYANIFIAMAMSLSVYDFSPVIDESGSPPPLKAEFMSGIVRCVKFGPAESLSNIVYEMK